jgi:hypothetical protein
MSTTKPYTVGSEAPGPGWFLEEKTTGKHVPVTRGLLKKIKETGKYVASTGMDVDATVALQWVKGQDPLKTKKQQKVANVAAAEAAAKEEYRKHLKARSKKVARPSIAQKITRRQRAALKEQQEGMRRLRAEANAVRGVPDLPVGALAADYRRGVKVEKAIKKALEHSRKKGVKAAADLEDANAKTRKKMRSRLGRRRTTNNQRRREALIAARLRGQLPPANFFENSESNSDDSEWEAAQEAVDRELAQEAERAAVATREADALEARAAELRAAAAEIRGSNYNSGDRVVIRRVPLPPVLESLQEEATNTNNALSALAGRMARLPLTS